MKPIFLINFFMLACLTGIQATIHTVHVADHFFNPAAFNAVVGDTVHWVWDNGTHTTTGNSGNIPQGAATWDAAMDAANQSFDYVIQAPGQYFYFSRLDGDMSASFTVTGTLPLQLTSFSVSSTAKKQALIKWTTATETNTSYFSLQKSTDGINFTTIAKITAAGNAATTKSYSFTDYTAAASNAVIYYRLAIVDKDAAITLSYIITSANSNVASKLAIKVFPNPVQHAQPLSIQFAADKQDKLYIKVYSFSGAVVQQAVIKTAAGTNTYQLNTANLSRGMYTLLCTCNNETVTKKIIVE